MVSQRSELSAIAWRLWVPLALFLIDGASVVAEGERSQGVDYEVPRFLKGTIYESKSGARKALFTFTRTAARSGSSVRVLREFNLPDGTLAARERVLYDSGRLASYELEDLQQVSRGSAVVGPDPKDGRKERLNLEYLPGVGTETRKKLTNSEVLGKDVLINDMIPPFILSHWDDLLRGSTEKFRLVVLPRTETVQFVLEKESEVTEQGRVVVRLRMEPANVVTAQLIEPIIFTVEKESPHRILQYSGRTTPQVKSGSRWKDLDALTVFEWK